MTSCAHEHLSAYAMPYVLNDETGAVVLRTVHVSCVCRDCGKPMRFEAPFQAAPEGLEALQTVTGPWYTQAQNEMGVRVTPFEERIDLAWVEPAGRA